MISRSRHHVFVLGSALVLASASLLRAQDPGQYGGGYANDNDPAASMISDNGQADPPQRVARIAVLTGPASFESADMNGFTAAELNYPMTSGDRLYSGEGAFAELQTGQIALRMGQNTDAEIIALTDTVARFGLAGGSLHLREFSLDSGSSVELDTPNVGIIALDPGDIRVDVDPDRDVTYLTVVSGHVQVQGNNFEQTFGPGATMVFSGADSLDVSTAGREQMDGLDSFSNDRDRMFYAAQQQEDQYLNPGTIGAADLAGYGDWDTDADYGAVWYPTGVAVDWEPYRVGHWAYVRPWGWTWVESEPWGFAPFHYGRWVHIGPRWAWVPGPPTFHPVYAPALVAFVGGHGFAGGATGWFPLGPRESYTPWYHVTPLYMNRVNVTNLHTRDVREARAIYNQRTLRPEFAPAPGNRNFEYRDHAVVMPSNSFAAGRPAMANRVQVSRDQLAAAPVMNRPEAAPGRSAGGRPPAAGAVPTHTARPVFEQPVDAGRRAGMGNPAGSDRGSRWNGQPAPRQGEGNDPGRSQQPVSQDRSPQPGEPVYRAPGGNSVTPTRDGGGRFNRGGESASSQPAPSNQQPQTTQPAPPQPGEPVHRNQYGNTVAPMRGGYGDQGRGQPQTPPVQQPQRPADQPTSATRPYMPRPAQPEQQPQGEPSPRWQGGRGQQPQPEYRQQMPQQPQTRQQEFRPQPQQPSRPQPPPPTQRSAPQQPSPMRPQPAMQPHDTNEKR